MVSTFVDRAATRLAYDMQLFLACTILDPSNRRFFTDHRLSRRLHLEYLSAIFPDVLTRDVMMSANNFFSETYSTGVDSIQLPDNIIKQQAKGTKGKKKKEAKRRTLVCYYLDVKKVTGSSMWADFCLKMAVIIPTSVKVEQGFSLLTDVLTQKRLRLSLAKVEAYGLMKGLKSFKDLLRSHKDMSMFDQLLMEFD
jgi:hypothetical protein